MLNSPVKDFELPATGDKVCRLSDYRGKWLVIYFYPKDSTPGCTTEGQEFRDLYSEFQKAGVEVLGISRDSIKSHQNFKAKLDLPFPLLSDSEEIVCTLFNVIKMKNMYGKQVRGIERSTFVLDASGALRHEWRGVKVNGHALQVLEKIKQIMD